MEFSCDESSLWRRCVEKEEEEGGGRRRSGVDEKRWLGVTSGGNILKFPIIVTSGGNIMN